MCSSDLTETRFDALRAADSRAFVGREGEIALLANRWRSAASGEGQVVLLEGEAGIGKSRLADEFRRSVAGDDHILLRYQCSPHFTNSAFYPFIAQLERACQFDSCDNTDDRLDNLERLLPSTTPDRARTLALFANLLALPTDRYPLPALEPEAVKAETMDAFVRQLGVLACDTTLLVLFEDAHWLDPTSLELLGKLIQAEIGRAHV